VPRYGSSTQPLSGGSTSIDGGATVHPLRATPAAALDTVDTTAAIAHDLQTPVAVIMGLCARIEAAGLSEGQVADLDRVRAQATAISHAASAMLDAERPLPAGDRRPIDVAPIAREVADELAVLAHERGAVIVVTTGGPSWVLARREEIASAIGNLVSNAVRQLSGGGCVRVSVRRIRGTIEVEVADSGPGVPESERQHVLEPFRQGSGARGGVGLGLGIVRATAGRLGGSIAVGDAPEGGASFTLALPEARLAARRRRRLHAPRRAAQRSL
jgi:two-component system sensor histidine kinase TctE